METQEERHKQYMKEIDKIEHDFIYFQDREGYHCDWDCLIIKILKENGYRDIAIMYEKASDDFWYA